jgi:glycine cleavage system aminomethyltransferase T
MIDRGGVFVAAHYGSSAGELSACVRTVGVGDRGDLQIFTLAGAPKAVQDVIQCATGVTLSVGGAVRLRGARWCCAQLGEVFLVVDPCASERRLEAISLRVRLRADVTVADVSDTWTAIAAVGARCEKLLELLGLGDSQSAPRPPFERATIAGVEGFVLRESRSEVLFLARTPSVLDLWRELRAVGRGLGISIVGIEALERFALHERLIHQAALQHTAIPA